MWIPRTLRPAAPSCNRATLDTAQHRLFGRTLFAATIIAALAATESALAQPAAQSARAPAGSPEHNLSTDTFSATTKSLPDELWIPVIHNGQTPDNIEPYAELEVTIDSLEKRSVANGRKLGATKISFLHIFVLAIPPGDCPPTYTPPTPRFHQDTLVWTKCIYLCTARNTCSPQSLTLPSGATLGVSYLLPPSITQEEGYEKTTFSAEKLTIIVNDEQIDWLAINKASLRDPKSPPPALPTIQIAERLSFPTASTTQRFLQGPETPDTSWINKDLRNSLCIALPEGWQSAEPQPANFQLLINDIKQQADFSITNAQNGAPTACPDLTPLTQALSASISEAIKNGRSTDLTVTFLDKQILMTTVGVFDNLQFKDAYIADRQFDSVDNFRSDASIKDWAESLCVKTVAPIANSQIPIPGGLLTIVDGQNQTVLSFSGEDVAFNKPPNSKDESTFCSPILYTAGERALRAAVRGDGFIGDSARIFFRGAPLGRAIDAAWYSYYTISDLRRSAYFATGIATSVRSDIDVSGLTIARGYAPLLGGSVNLAKDFGFSAEFGVDAGIALAESSDTSAMNSESATGLSIGGFASVCLRLPTAIGVRACIVPSADMLAVRRGVDTKIGTVRSIMWVLGLGAR